jgi:hypothetical protein
MNWLKRKLEIRRLKKREREKFWEMVSYRSLAQGSEDDAVVRKALDLEREVDELRARIAELGGDA